MPHIIITRSDKGAQVSIDGADIGWADGLPEAHKLIRDYQSGDLEAKPAPAASEKPKRPAKAKPAPAA